MNEVFVDRCECVCVLSSGNVRLQVVSAEEGGELHLSLLGCRMELAESLLT